MRTLTEGNFREGSCFSGGHGGWSASGLTVEPSGKRVFFHALGIGVEVPADKAEVVVDEVLERFDEGGTLAA